MSGPDFLHLPLWKSLGVSVDQAWGVAIEQRKVSQANVAKTPRAILGSAP